MLAPTSCPTRKKRGGGEVIDDGLEVLRVAAFSGVVGVIAALLHAVAEEWWRRRTGAENRGFWAWFVSDLYIFLLGAAVAASFCLWFD
jgi:hypothetical protein